jgi:hypothetical protein
LLLLHPVHGRCTIVHLTNFVSDTGVVQDALGGGGFTRVNVSHDANVSNLV